MIERGGGRIVNLSSPFAQGHVGCNLWYVNDGGRELAELKMEDVQNNIGSAI